MATLFDITLDLARAIGQTYTGFATGGSTTTLVDANADSWTDDFWNRGAIWFQSGNNIGKTAIITDFTNSSRTWTFAAQSLACAAGNLYTVCRVPSSLVALRAAVNVALKDVGKTMSVNTSLTGVADQLEYTLPTGVFDIRRITVTPSGGKAAINYWWKVYAGKIFFLSGKEPKANDAITLYYVSIPAELAADGDTVPAHVDLKLLRTCALYNALWMVFEPSASTNEMVKTRLPVAKQDADAAILRAHSSLLPRDFIYPGI